MAYFHGLHLLPQSVDQDANRFRDVSGSGQGVGNASLHKRFHSSTSLSSGARKCILVTEVDGGPQPGFLGMADDRRRFLVLRDAVPQLFCARSVRQNVLCKTKRVL